MGNGANRMTRKIGGDSLAALLAGALTLVAAGAAHAQSIFGFAVGEDFQAAAKAHGPPSSKTALGPNIAYKWKLPSGADVSVTAAAQTGRILYVESDHGRDAANTPADAPGFTFGTTSLADIREKFQSNGFGFKANLGRVMGANLVSFNCYGIKGHDDLVVVFVTLLPVSGIPIVDGKPVVNLGKGHLDAVILANLAYLQDIWGQDRLFDPAYHPVDWK